MPKIVDIPGVGHVEFPDSMGDEDIGAALSKQFAASPQSSAAGAFVDHAANGGLMGFGDELVGGYKAIAKKLLPQALGGAPVGAPMADTYRRDRDEVRQRFAQERSEHPAASIGGEIAGALGPALLTGGGSAAAQGPGIAARLLGAVGVDSARAARLLTAGASGAAYGGAAGLGNSEKDTAGGVTGDVGRGAAAGGVLGTALQGAGEVAPSVAAKLRDMAINQGRRFLSGTSTSLSRAKPLASDAVEEAFAQRAISPGSTVASAAEKLHAATDDVGALYGRIIDALEANGISGPGSKSLAQEYAAKATAANANTMNPAVPGVYQDAAKQLAGKPVDAAGNLALSQGEKLKQSLQDMARSAYKQQKPGEEGRALKEAASMMRQANEDAISQQAAASGDPTVQLVADGFVPVKQKLSRLISASDAAELAAQRAQKNHSIGLKEVGLAAGDPGKLLAAFLLKGRGASTAAWSAMKASEGVEGLASYSPARQFLLRLAQQEAAQSTQQ